ncbi:hypothetical protein J6590_095247 [Homalodisca vitripennis]|nr:hypothetical protein J6590_095247 [Homalodisca vitripennis]
MSTGANNALFQAVDLTAEVLDGLVGGEVATKNCNVPTLCPDESSALSMAPHQNFLWIPHPESSRIGAVRPLTGSRGVAEPKAAEAPWDDNSSFNPATHPANSQMLESLLACLSPNSATAIRC